MPAAEEDRPRILQRSEHPISRKQFDKNAVKVMYRLHRAGFKSYLVGGGVRDLMLGRKPKDYDLSTDARPQQVRRLFRNSRLIGRRFKLVHVYFREGIIEVATFRRDPDPESQAGGPDELLITDDNVFGGEREDAFRRDFTVNALFYNIADFTVIDYVGGIDDLEQRTIRTIGDPDVRFREDPVRMMRACEMAGRLEFTIDDETQRAIHRHRDEILKAAPPRLTEELVQLLACGHAGRAVQWMLDLGLLEVLLPEAYDMVSAGRAGAGNFGRVLPVIDDLVVGGRELSDTVLLAALVLPRVLQRRRDVEAVDQRPARRGTLMAIVGEVLEEFAGRFALSRARSEGILQAILGHDQLVRARWSDARRRQYARRAFFDDALALLEIFSRATGEGGEAVALWRRVRERLDAPGARPGRRRQRRRRRRSRRKAGAAD